MLPYVAVAATIQRAGVEQYQTQDGENNQEADHGVGGLAVAEVGAGAGGVGVKYLSSHGLP